jgi:hypothetical protein
MRFPADHFPPLLLEVLARHRITQTGLLLSTWRVSTSIELAGRALNLYHPRCPACLDYVN